MKVDPNSSSIGRAKSVAQLSAWLSDFGDKNREHFEKGAAYKNARRSKIQQRVKQFESFGLSTSSSTSTDGGFTNPNHALIVSEPPTIANSHPALTLDSSINRLSHHHRTQSNPVFRDFGIAGAPSNYSHQHHTPPRTAPPPQLYPTSSSSSSPSSTMSSPNGDKDNIQEDVRVVAITKLLQNPPKPHRRHHSESLFSWDASSDDNDKFDPLWDKPDPVWSRVELNGGDKQNVSQANFESDSKQGQEKSSAISLCSGRVGKRRDDESSNQQSVLSKPMSKLALLRCVTHHGTSNSTGSETPRMDRASQTQKETTTSIVENGLFPSRGFHSASSSALPRYQSTTKNVVTEPMDMSAEGHSIWNEDRRPSFHLPSLEDKAGLGDVFDELDLEWRQTEASASVSGTHRLSHVTRSDDSDDSTFMSSPRPVNGRPPTPAVSSTTRRRYTPDNATAATITGTSVQHSPTTTPFSTLVQSAWIATGAAEDKDESIVARVKSSNSSTNVRKLPKKSLVAERQAQIAQLQEKNRVPQFATKAQWQQKKNGGFAKRYVVVENKSPGSSNSSSNSSSGNSSRHGPSDH